MDRPDKTALTPANQNPWYLLMTLYGEQEGEEVDLARQVSNRQAWNAWAGQGMSISEREELAKSTVSTVAELTAWPEKERLISQMHQAEMRTRNGVDFVYPGLPNYMHSVNLEDVEFTRNLLLFGFVFSGLTYFNRASFSEGAIIGGAVFRGATFFDDSTFSKEAAFVMASFKSGAHFPRVTFKMDAIFESAIFSGFTTFTRAIFGEKNNKSNANFSDCQFHQPTNFRDAVFHSNYPDFSGAVLHDKTTFTAKPENWPTCSQSDPSQAKASCAAIRHNLGKQGLPEAEHFFFRREMGFAGQIGRWWEQLPYRAFGWFSNYGHSIQKPALWLLGMCITVGMINHVVLQWGTTLHGDTYHPAQAFALAISNQFPVLGLQTRWLDVGFLKDLNPWLKFLGGLQTILALPLLFLLALGLRTRFRMR